MANNLTSSPADIAWLAMFSTTTAAPAPALTAAEVGRLKMLRDWSADVRVSQRAAAVCTVNGIT
jgi:hypothetical protein